MILYEDLCGEVWCGVSSVAVEVNINIGGECWPDTDRWGFVGKICHKHSPRIL